MTRWCTQRRELSPAKLLNASVIYDPILLSAATAGVAGVVVAAVLLRRRWSRQSAAASSPQLRLFGTVQWRNQFEFDNVVTTIIAGDEYELGDQTLEPGDVIVDVGAHIGVFSALCYHRGSRAIHSFEPNEDNFRLLEQNVRGRPGVCLSRRAVWRSDGESGAGLLLSGPDGENTGAHSLLTAGLVPDFGVQTLTEAFATSHPVETVPLDEILSGFDRVKLLKIDCEGGEFPILLTSRLLSRVERIVGEIHELTGPLMESVGPASRLAGYESYRAEDLVDRLRSLGFEVRSREASRHLHIFSALNNEVKALAPGVA
jgi:FkbM family methyltransferase